MNLQPMTLRQAKMLAKKTQGAFSCNIAARDCEAPFYGLSTVFMFHGRVLVFAPWQWETPRRAVQVSH